MPVSKEECIKFEEAAKANAIEEKQKKFKNSLFLSSLKYSRNMEYLKNNKDKMKISLL